MELSSGGLGPPPLSCINRDPGPRRISAMGGNAGTNPSKSAVDRGVDLSLTTVAELLRVDTVHDLYALSRFQVGIVALFPLPLAERLSHHICLRWALRAIERRRNKKKRKNPRRTSEWINATANIVLLEMPWCAEMLESVVSGEAPDPCPDEVGLGLEEGVTVCLAVGLVVELSRMPWFTLVSVVAVVVGEMFESESEVVKPFVVAM
jgi:hypothetical protein